MTLKSRSGGVLIAVRNKFFANVLSSITNDVEHIFVDIIINSNKIIIGAAYIASDHIYTSHCLVIQKEPWKTVWTICYIYAVTIFYLKIRGCQ